MQTCVEPSAGVGQLEGAASVIVESRLKLPITLSTVSSMRLLVRQPEPLALGVNVVPEQLPKAAPNALSVGTSLATAWRAAWRAASATVEVTQSTRNRSIDNASRKKRRGKTRANSTKAWPWLRLCLRINTRPAART